MPIVLTLRPGGRLWPMLRCDVCGRVIEAEGAGNVVWRVGAAEAASPGEDVPYFLAHKGACDRSLEAAFGSRGDYAWMPIDFFLVRVCHNAAVDVPKARTLLREIGWAL